MRWIDPINWPWWAEFILGCLLWGVVASDISHDRIGWAVFDGILAIASFGLARHKYRGGFGHERH